VNRALATPLRPAIGRPGLADVADRRARVDDGLTSASCRHCRAVDVVVAGGMENMRRAPHLIPSGRFGARMGDADLIDSMVHDGL
jgi:hypothetical protein